MPIEKRNAFGTKIAPASLMPSEERNTLGTGLVPKENEKKACVARCLCYLERMENNSTRINLARRDQMRDLYVMTAYSVMARVPFVPLDIAGSAEAQARIEAWFTAQHAKVMAEAEAFGTKHAEEKI